MIELLLAFVALCVVLAMAYHIKQSHEKIQQQQSIINANQAAQAAQAAQTSPKSAPVVIAPASASLDAALKIALDEVQGCQAVAYVDTSHNVLLGIQSSVPFPPAIVELVAATVTDLFTTPNLLKMSYAFKQFKGQETDKSNFHEMVVRGDSLLYVLLRASSNENRVFAFACADDGETQNNVGLILHQARSQMPKMEVAAEAGFLTE